MSHEGPLLGRWGAMRCWSFRSRKDFLIERIALDTKPTDSPLGREDGLR